MPNFPPLRSYCFSVVDRWIRQDRLEGPFLDVGCGTGALARHLAERGWTGVALDSSERAAAAARTNLESFPSVEVKAGNLDQVAGRKFNVIFIMDVLEHVRDDEALLRRLSGMLEPAGTIMLLAPVNPREWRQDDVLYGHFRRYDWDDMDHKLSNAGLMLIDRWNVTVPVMWALRRVYLAFLPSPRTDQPQDTLTDASSFYNPWSEHAILRVVGATLEWPLWWKIPFLMQDSFANSRGGHAAMFLARKTA